VLAAAVVVPAVAAVVPAVLVELAVAVRAAQKLEVDHRASLTLAVAAAVAATLPLEMAAQAALV
jgi:hypothetical protein